MRKYTLRLNTAAIGSMALANTAYAKGKQGSKSSPDRKQKSEIRRHLSEEELHYSPMIH